MTLESLRKAPEVPLARSLLLPIQPYLIGASPRLAVPVRGPTIPIVCNHRGVLLKVYAPSWLAALLGISRNYLSELGTKGVVPKGLICLNNVRTGKSGWKGSDNRFYTGAEMKAYFLLFLHYGGRKAFADQSFSDACNVVRRRLRKALDLGPVEDIQLTREMIAAAKRSYVAKWDVALKRYLDRTVWEILGNESSQYLFIKRNPLTFENFNNCRMEFFCNVNSFCFWNLEIDNGAAGMNCRNNFFLVVASKNKPTIISKFFNHCTQGWLR